MRNEQEENHMCTCSRDGYSPDCPQSFYQNGVLLHTISGETKLKPRTYGPPPGSGHATPGIGQRLIAASDEAQSVDNLLQSVENLVLDKQGTIPAGAASDNFNGARKTPYSTDEDLSYSSSEYLRMGQHNSLDRFKPLSLNGVTMTQATIGGYQLDIEAVAKRAAKVIPLPPVALPLIFRDTDLNFCHHLFQGLDILGGRELITSIAESGTYHAKDKDLISPLVSLLISSGYIENDSELAIFVKRVFSVTFESVSPGSSKQESSLFRVVSNFYGFQYIEHGMLCREQDLKMWLHSSYVHYRMLWFNAFKSSGVPAFALEGVQDRYAGKSECPLTRGYDRTTDHKVAQAIAIAARGERKGHRRHREGTDKRHKDDSSRRWQLLG